MNPRAGQQDLYEVLGVPRDADAKAVRKAYHALARKYHPDVNPDDAAAEDRFKAISEAYSVLSDETKRANYDEFGPISLEGSFDADTARAARHPFGGFGAEGPRGRAADGDFGGRGFGFGNVEDLFGNLFGGRSSDGGGGSFSLRGRDLEASLELDFLEAARGCEKQLIVNRPTADGQMRPETVSVRIPAGVDTGGRIRLAGKGGEGHGGGPPGDLFARIKVGTHPWFKRDGRNLLIDLPITVTEALLGAKVEVPTLGAVATVTIPPGTDSGQRLRLRGKGIPSPRGGEAGDLYATVQIRVPDDLSEEARAQVASLLDENGDALRGWASAG